MCVLPLVSRKPRVGGIIVAPNLQIRKLKSSDSNHLPQTPQQGNGQVGTQIPVTAL